MISYRKEIDGLRAIAVIPVVFFHAGLTSFSGGYVGVDVFFVISGYLITSLIVVEKEREEFSIINFYERRARRILPALFFMSLVCVPFSFLLMSPIQLKEFSDSLISIPLFVSNFVFWSESGYFSTVAEEKPLLHTWSLAVEEQYYLLFPIFILIFWRLKKAILISIIFIVSILSLLLAQFGSNLNSQPPFYDEVFRYNAIPDFAFFLAPTRAWELLFGSLTAFFLLKERNTKFYINQILSLTGMLMILFSIIAFDSSTPFPGFSALLPVLGTVLIILFAKEGTVIYRILSLRLLVFFGLISYSIYLWHQPLFAFARLSSVNSPSTVTYVILCFISFFLGWLSWKYIEAPFRKKGKMTRNTIFFSSFSVGVLIILLGIVGSKYKGFENLYTQEDLSAIQPERFNNNPCLWSNPISGFPEIRFCSLGNVDSKEPPVLLYGDSHADALTISFHSALLSRGLKGIKISNQNCEPIVNFYRKENTLEPIKKKCEASHFSLMNLIQAMQIKHIIILNRWSFRLFPVEDKITSLNFDNEEGGIEYVKNYREYYSKTKDGFDISGEAKKMAFREFINGFLDNDVKVKLIYPIPEVGWHLSKLNTIKLNFENKIPETLSTSLEVFKKRQSFSYEILDSIGNHKLLERIYPSSIFCDSDLKGRCIVQTGGTPLYYDSDHLSNEGAKFLINKTALID